jgi:hypothetical protein
MRITYIIRQDGDPVETEVAGFKFIAGAETNVDDPEIIAMLSTNPWFRVEGVSPIRGALSEVNRDPTPIQLYKRGPGRPRKVEL